MSRKWVVERSVLRSELGPVSGDSTSRYSTAIGGQTVGNGLNFGTPADSVDGVLFSVYGTLGAIPGETDYDHFAFDATAVPEPGTYALMAVGLLGLTMAQGVVTVAEISGSDGGH